jgi:hypothetical protein
MSQGATEFNLKTGEEVATHSQPQIIPQIIPLANNYILYDGTLKVQSPGAPIAPPDMVNKLLFEYRLSVNHHPDYRHLLATYNSNECVRIVDLEQNKLHL